MESQVSTEFTLRLSSGGQIRREELIISEYLRQGKYSKLFLFLSLFFGPAGALWKSSGVTCYSLSGNWAENVNEYLSSWWGCVGRQSTEGCKKVQRGGVRTRE